MRTAPVSEIFASIQGEGPRTGERQIFVRFAGCPLRCNYCDTPASLVPDGHPRKSADEIVEAVLELQRRSGSRISTVSVTGGEPLVHAAFHEEWLPRVRAAGLSVYLETAGVHAEALRRILPLCDFVSMDMKLPSATGESHWDQHAAFLDAAGAKVFVKIVLESRSTADELARAVDIIAARRPQPTLILQPATAQGPDVRPPSADIIADLAFLARARLADVRVQPQQHKLWGVS